MKKLVFVYNGDSGLFNGVMHYLHKKISPRTYPCALCGLIYDGTSLNREWLAFVKSLPIETEFLHRDEYQKSYGASSTTWPAVLLHEGKTLTKVVVRAEDFGAIPSLEALQTKIGEVVATEGGGRNAG